MLDAFQLPYVQRGLVEVLLLSAGAGLMGTWIVLRGLAFFSHAVGAATFPGLVIADGLGFAAPLGAFAAALLYAAGVGSLSRARDGDRGSETALVLAGALALGVILASDVFHSGANIETLLFGSLLVIDSRDLALAGGASLLAVGATLTAGRAWLATGFDAEGSRALGLRSKLPEAALLAFISLTVVSMLAALGALLAAALLIVPAATTRIWVRRLGRWQLATVLLVALEGTAGVWLSVQTDAPPGATIALLAGGGFAASAIARALITSKTARVAAASAATAGLSLLVVLLLAGCGGSDDSSAGEVEAVATTTQIGDWARQVGGDRANVTQLLAPNSDPHDYEPRPSDIAAVANAKVVFTSGNDLDGWIDEVVEQSGGHPEVVDLGRDPPIKLPGKHGGPEASRYDPHWWHDPRNVEAAVEQIRDALDAADPGAPKTFDRNARSYNGELRVLDREIRACIDRVPIAQRKLVTDHDAFGYFASRYGIEVVGAVIPSQTTQGQPSAGDVAKLTDRIEQENVKAVFPEESVSPKLADSIARETGALSNFKLYGDTLGPAGSDGATYIQMEQANAQSIVEGLGGRKLTCSFAGP